MQKKTGTDSSKSVNTEVDDTELIFSIKEGSKEALAAIVQRYQKRLMSVAYRMTGDWHESQDIVQDVFVTLMKKIDTFDPEKKFFSWIYRITVNRTIDFLRVKGRESAREKLPTEKTSRTSEDILVSGEVREKVRDTLAELPVKYRTVLILRDIEGLTTEKIADILDLVPATARWRIFQARKLFREKWDMEKGAGLI